MRQAIDHRQAPVQQELLKYINMIRAEITAKMVPAPVAQSDALSDALTHATAMRRRLHPLGKSWLEHPSMTRHELLPRAKAPR
jgi:hypothetical protein